MRSALLYALAGLAAVNAIPTIEVKGSKLFTSDGDQFFIKGERQLPVFANSVMLTCP
jgi:hypothetical protein